MGYGSIESIMSKDVLCASPEDTLADLLSMLHKNRIGCVPVCEDDVPVGMITCPRRPSRVHAASASACSGLGRGSSTLGQETLAGCGRLSRKCGANLPFVIERIEK